MNRGLFLAFITIVGFQVCEAQSISITGKKEFLVGIPQADAVTVTLIQNDGKPKAGKTLTLKFTTSDTGDVDPIAQGTTDANGVAKFTIKGKTAGKGILKASWSGLEDSLKISIVTPAISFQASMGVTQLQAKQAYPGVVKVLAKIGDDPLIGSAFTARVTTGNGKITNSPQSTDNQGSAQFDLKTGDTGGPIIILIQSIADPSKTEAANANINAYESDTGSWLVRTDLVLGTTFHNRYEKVVQNEGTANEETIYENKGFDKTSALALLNFDTLWGYDKNYALHTGVNLALSSIAVTDPMQGSNATSFADYADLFGGEVYVHYQPGWRKKDSTYSLKKKNRNKDKPYDSFRFGFIAKAGFAQRESLPNDGGDTAISRYGIGATFTHHRTSAATAKEDNFNIMPLRYIEFIPTVYEDYAGRKDNLRLVINGGLRINALGNDGIPFYTGIHANLGEGPDDVRLVAGLIFDLDKLASLFQ